MASPSQPFVRPLELSRIGEYMLQSKLQIKLRDM